VVGRPARVKATRVTGVWRLESDFVAEGEAPGQAVDPRFALANERTLLAWLRTALALLAAAGAVQQFSDFTGRTGLALLVSMVGVAAAIAGGRRYQRTDAALRRGQGTPPGRAPLALAVAVAVIGLVLTVAIAVAF